jgi:hypothetical protein
MYRRRIMIAEIIAIVVGEAVAGNDTASSIHAGSQKNPSRSPEQLLRPYIFLAIGDAVAMSSS